MTAAVVRVQREYIPGWRLPGNTVFVGRPGRFCNPYKVTNGRTPAEAVAMYEQVIMTGAGWVHAKYRHAPSIETIKRSLAGRNLACWCPLDQPCHADVLLKIANS